MLTSLLLKPLRILLDYSEGNLGTKGQTFPSGDRTYTSREVLRNVYAALLSGGLEIRMATHAIGTLHVFHVYGSR
jgi:hypothetical protein